MNKNLNRKVKVPRKIKKRADRMSPGCLSRIMSVLFTMFLICLITGTIVGAAFALYLRSFVNVSVDDILLLSSGQDLTTRIYYMDYSDRANRIGEAVEIEDQSLSASENRVWASYDQIPQTLVRAFIAIEDKRFDDHKGVDWRRTFSATAYYFLPGGGHYGGSTITQQVIKNVTGNDDVTIQRKVQEIFMALNLEKKLDKTEIMEIYLNTIYLSQHSYGVAAAAQTYFGKDLSELSLVECAAIAGITQYPTKWDPVQNPDNNVERRRVVLTAMRDQGYISEEEYQEAYYAELELNLNTSTGTTSGSSYNSWYTDQVITDSIELLQNQLGVSKTVATSMIYTGGLQIYTLMDPDVQRSLEEVFADDSRFPRTGGSLQPKASMVILDPATGDVLGLAGDRGVKNGDRLQSYATQTRRSPGSSIKPISVYAPALEAGLINYATVLDDVPLNYGDDGKTPWPSNSPYVYNGLTTIHDAISRSVNTVSLRTLNKLGVEQSFDFLKNKLHMDSLIDSETTESGTVVSDMTQSSLGLGGMTYGVTVLEMTAAYCMFANGGVYNKPRTVLRILDSQGNVIVDNSAESNTAISENTAAIMTKMLQEVVSSGTGKNAITLDEYVNVAGKTGTTNSDIDKWFVGYTPYYVGGVWFGYEWNKSLTSFRFDAAARIWNEVMLDVHKSVIDQIDAGGSVKQYFTTPASIVTAKYCKYCGKLATDLCAKDKRGDASETGFFTADNKPTEKCDCHVLVDICKTSGDFATTGCTSTEKVAFVKWTRDSVPSGAGISITDAEYLCPTDKCKTHSGDFVNDPEDKTQVIKDDTPIKDLITDNDSNKSTSPTDDSQGSSDSPLDDIKSDPNDN